MLSNRMVMEFRRMLENYLKENYANFEDAYSNEILDNFESLRGEEIDESSACASFEYEDDDGDTVEIEASVSRSRDYEGIKASCDCSDFEETGKCVHIGMLLRDISDGMLFSGEYEGIDTLPTLIPELPEEFEEEQILETAKEHPEMYANCIIAMDKNLASDIAVAIRDREHVYREMNYLACFIDSKARDRNIPDNFQLHYLFELASNFAAAVMAFDDIDYSRLITEEVRLLKAADYYGGRCIKYEDPFNMDLNRVWRLINMQLPLVPDDKRLGVIVSCLYPLNEESAQYLLFGVKNMLTDFEIKALGVKLAEKGLKKAAKDLGWKKKSKKKR